MLSDSNPVLTLVGIARVYLKRIPYNNQFYPTRQANTGPGSVSIAIDSSMWVRICLGICVFTV